MKKVFLFLLVFFAFSAVCSAQRIDVPVDDDGYEVVILKAKVLKHSDEKSNKMLNFYYEQDEQALYINAHGDAHGRLFLQKNKRIEKTVEECINRLINENINLFNGLSIKKIYLMSCYAESRHQDNPKNLFIGHCDSLNADIFEISRYNGYLHSDYYVKDGFYYSLEYDFTYANPKHDSKIYKLVKDAAKASNADWAVEMLK